MITHLVPPEQFDSEHLAVDGAAYRHLFRARRVASEARLRIVDGNGQARWGVVQKIDRQCAHIQLGDRAPAHEPAYQLELVVAALRTERASWLVQKSTELGVHAFCFVSTHRTPRKYGMASLDRLRRVARAAVVQSHRSWLPRIHGVEAWDTLTSRLGAEPASTHLTYLDRDGSKPEGPPGVPNSRGIVLIGPEGGWDPREKEELANLGCQALSLGERTLRVETAAVAIAARLL